MRDSVTEGTPVPRDTESTHSDKDGAEKFHVVVSALSEGALTFPAPFDLSSSAALAANTDEGRIAQELFRVTAERDCAYEVLIRAVPQGEEKVGEREVLATKVTSKRQLIVLLETLLDELDPQESED